MSQLAEYIAAILLDKAKSGPGEAYGGSVQRIRDRLARDVGGNVSPDDIALALSILEPFAAADSDYSPLTGGYWTISYDNFRYYFIETQPEAEDDQLVYSELSEKTASYPILQAYARRGSNYALDAALHLQNLRFDRWDELRAEAHPAATIPASNRIVTRADNRQEIEAIEAEVLELVDEIVSNNEVGEELGDARDVVAGELRAAETLIKQPAFRVSRLAALVLPVLRFLGDKFAAGAVGEMAKRLITLILGLG